MRLSRWAAICLVVVAAWSWLVQSPPAGAQGRDVAGVITEIKMGGGRVDIRRAGSPEWRPAAPLVSLAPGDQIRVTRDARVVVLPSGARGTIAVGAADSPFTVSVVKVMDSKLEKARTLLQSSIGYLSGTRVESMQPILSTRGTKPPVILGPRNGPVLPGVLALEWRSSPGIAYTVRVFGPGVEFERQGITGGRLDYPATAPALVAGARYVLEVVGPGHPTQQAWFEVVDVERANVIRRDLADLEQETSASMSGNTRALLAAGLLASNGLVHDATRTVSVAIARDPLEPTFYLLLGNLLESTGLTEEAADAFRQARMLLSRM